MPTPIEAQAVAAEASLGLTESQLAAYREIRRRRVVAVWGPPGTGKTHFLTVAILGLARAYAAAGMPFRVLVTAFTQHYRIDTTGTRRWKPFVGDGMLCVGLLEEGTVITGNRTKRAFGAGATDGSDVEAS